MKKDSEGKKEGEDDTEANKDSKDEDEINSDLDDPEEEEDAEEDEGQGGDLIIALYEKVSFCILSGIISNWC